MANSHSNPPSSTQERSCLVPYVDPLTAEGNVKETLDSMPFTRNIFLLLGQSSGLFPPLMKVYQAAFNGQTRKLPVLDWQLVVLRIAARLDAPYPWDVNEPVARINGMPKANLDAMGDAPESIQADYNDIWSIRQKAILRVVDEQLKNYTNETKTIENARKHLSVEELVEVFIILGVYALIAR